MKGAQLFLPELPRQDQNDPANWGLLDALGRLGAEPDVSDQQAELQGKLDKIDKTFMDIFKRNEEFRSKYPDTKFFAPPGRTHQISASQGTGGPTDLTEFIQQHGTGGGPEDWNHLKDLIEQRRDKSIPVQPTYPGTPKPDPQGMGRDVRISSLDPAASGPTVPVHNLDAARKDLQLTPQEDALYQRHLQNLYGSGGVDNPDGSRSTLYQMSFDHGGKTYNVPTVYDGKIVKPDEAVDRAFSQGIDSFPSYANSDEAEQRYQQMHDYMERDTQDYLRDRPAPPSTYMFPYDH